MILLRKIFCLNFFLWLNLLFPQNSSGQEVISTDVLLSEQKSLPFLSGGSVVSVGADLVDVRRLTAWFYGSKTITTCYQYATEFGVSEGQVEAAIRQALKNWRGYFKEHSTNREKAKAQTINGRFEFIGKCRGEESLVLFFGPGPIFGNLQDLKAVQALQQPLAYVNKTHMSRNLEWSKGYVRIVSQGYYDGGKNGQRPLPDWQKKNSLAAVVTHELGHVLGYSHVSGTIMDEKIVSHLFLKKERSFDSDIEQFSSLAFCRQCEEKLALIESPAEADRWRELGFETPSRLKLQRSGDEFSLSDGRFAAIIQVNSKTELSETGVLYSNFPQSDLQIQKSFLLYGTIQSKDGLKKQSLLLTYNGLPGRDKKAMVELRQLYADKMGLPTYFGIQK